MPGIPTFLLSTVFIDNGHEREGDNIDNNISILTKDYENDAHDSKYYGSEQAVLKRLIEAAAKVPEGPNSIPNSSVLTSSVKSLNHSLESTNQMETAAVNTSKSGVDGHVFVSTLRGMYGDSSRSAAPRYVQDRQAAVAGLRRQAAALGLDDQPNPEADEMDNRSSAPCGLSRVLRTKIAENDEGTQGVTFVCPHCDLTKEDPPVFQLSVTPSNPPLTESLQQKRRRYGNLPLGILTPQHSIDNLWNLVAMLEPPRQFQVSNYPPSERNKVQQLSVDEWAMMASKHFTAHIGAPPWQEYFARRKADLEEWAGQVQAECDRISARIREIQTNSDTIKFRVQAMERVLAMRDAFDERLRLQAQLSALQQELILRRWETEDGQRRIEADELRTLKGKAVAAVTHEEIRRVLAQITDMTLLSGALGLECHEQLSRTAREGVLKILEDMPTARGDSLRRVLSRSHDAHQCDACLLLTASSPYCPTTGQPHTDVLADLFDNFTMAANNGMPFEDKEPSNTILNSPNDVQPSLLESVDKERTSVANTSVPSSDPPPEKNEAGVKKTSVSVSKMVKQKSVSASNMAQQNTFSLNKRSVRKTNSRDTAAEKARAAAEARRKRELEELLGSTSTDDEHSTDSDSSAFSVTQLADEESPRRRSRDFTDTVKSPIVNTEEMVANTSHSRSHTLNLIASINALRKARLGKSSSETFKGQLPQILPSTVAIETMTHHIWQYLSAAADKNFPVMRKITRQLGLPPFTLLFTDVTLRSLLESEEQFYSWYSVVGQLQTTAALSELPIASLARKAKSTTYKSVEQRIISLRKELRNLEYAFHKRPKGRSGAILDNSSFAALALKISDFERKNANLRIKIRQVNEQRRALTRSNTTK